MDPRVGRRRRLDQVVQGHLIGPGQGQQQFQGRLPAAGLQARQRAHRDAGRPRDGAQGHVPLGAERAQPRTHGVEDVVHRRRLELLCHIGNHSCRTGQAARLWPHDLQRQQYDVVIIGGGAAGLSGAVALARSRRSVLVVDAGRPRNAPADGVHNYLGREGTPPGELLAIGRAEVAGYGGEVVPGVVTGARREDDGDFRVTLDDGREVSARRLLVATGLVDELPDLPGVAERWGRDVLHCPYCHGWEVRDQAIGILATGPTAVHQALLFRQLSDDVTFFRHTGPDLPRGGGRPAGRPRHPHGGRRGRRARGVRRPAHRRPARLGRGGAALGRGGRPAVHRPRRRPRRTGPRGDRAGDARPRRRQRRRRRPDRGHDRARRLGGGQRVRHVGAGRRRPPPPGCGPAR